MKIHGFTPTTHFLNRAAMRGLSLDAIWLVLGKNRLLKTNTETHLYVPNKEMRIKLKMKFKKDDRRFLVIVIRRHLLITLYFGAFEIGSYTKKKNVDIILAKLN